MTIRLESRRCKAKALEYLHSVGSSLDRESSTLVLFQQFHRLGERCALGLAKDDKAGTVEVPLHLGGPLSRFLGSAVHCAARLGVV